MGWHRQRQILVNAALCGDKRRVYDLPFWLAVTAISSEPEAFQRLAGIMRSGLALAERFWIRQEQFLEAVFHPDPISQTVSAGALRGDRGGERGMFLEELCVIL